MNNRPDDLETIPELDLTGGVRGKYYDRYMRGANVVVLEPDVAKKLHDPAKVNQALRTFLAEHGDAPPSETASRDDTTHHARDRNAPWRLELTESFLASLMTLPDTVAVGAMLASLLERIGRQPQVAPILPGTRVQVLTTDTVSISGQEVPALRLVYVIGHSNDTVRVLLVQPANEPLEIPPNISAQLQPILNASNMLGSQHKAD